MLIFFLTHCTTFFKFFVSKDLSEFISCTKYLVQYLVRIKVQKSASYYKHTVRTTDLKVMSSSSKLAF